MHSITRYPANVIFAGIFKAMKLNTIKTNTKLIIDLFSKNLFPTKFLHNFKLSYAKLHKWNVFSCFTHNIAHYKNGNSAA